MWSPLSNFHSSALKAGFYGEIYVHYISSLGRQKYRRYLYGTPVYTEKLGKVKKDKDGYVMIGNSIKSNFHGHIHRLMAKCLLDDFSEDLTVNHKNLIKDDNRIDNLEMLTLKDNINHAWAKKKKENSEKKRTNTQ